MTEKIAMFYVVAFTVLLVLNIFYKSIPSQIAFIWFGPVPKDGEYLSAFKARKIKYALSWLFQFIYAFAIIYLLAKMFPWLEKEVTFLMFIFAAIIGCGMAVLASVGFVVSYVKTKLLGPERQFEIIEEELDEEDW
ncbi:hypothetical protein [Pseudoalteromonas sp. T1lg21]|uniref:hypothetical protein n=1 Tax=Pseudoalteromonas sp. T1lg21 TaxID=2077095 RepID=UPI000CF61F66|nr:hypothetical protein [Pseudoalteromonas sp. T1lg21]